MRIFWKMTPMKIAAVMLALGAVATLPACAQTTYGDRYYGDDSPSGYPLGVYGDGYYGDGAGYDGAYYGTGAYGYCDIYGCPDDYWSLPLYYGSIYYDGAWFGGPLYYRDWGGQRQYWIRGGWHHDGWRGTRPSRYRAGYTGPALGLNWYRSHGVFRQGFHGGSNRNAYGRTRHYGYDGHGNANRYGNSRSNNSDRYGYGGHTVNRPENRYRNSFTGQANRGEFHTRTQGGGGHGAGVSTPWRGNRMGHSGSYGGHSGGGRGGGDHR